MQSRNGRKIGDLQENGENRAICLLGGGENNSSSSSPGRRIGDVDRGMPGREVTVTRN